MKTFIITIFSTFLFSACSQQYSKKSALQSSLDSFLALQKADIGVSIIGPEANDTFNYRAKEHLIMMSVVKFPQAVAILNLVDKGVLSLDSVLRIDSNELKRNTWSLIAETYKSGMVDLTLKECLEYAVGHSDNIACDRIYELLSCHDVETYIRSLGIPDIGIASPYRTLDVNHLEVNYTSAQSMTLLLNLIRNKKILSDKSRDFLIGIMRNTTTGEHRLKALLPKDAIIAHKTGTFFDNDSLIKAINDVGIVDLPNGQSYCISVIVNNSLMGPDATEKCIAEINLIAYNYYLGKH